MFKSFMIAMGILTAAFVVSVGLTWVVVWIASKVFGFTMLSWGKVILISVALTILGMFFK